MKKYLLVSLAMLCAAAFVWADEAKEAEGLKMDVKGSATLEWGIDRGSGKEARSAHGFNNKAEVEVTVPIIKKGDKTSKGDAPVYAEVSIKTIELNLKGEAKDDGPGDPSNKKEINGDVKDINAKLHFYGAYLTVYDMPSFKPNYASIWEPINKGDKYKDQFKYAPGFQGFGTKLGYAKKELMDLDVGVKFGSSTNMDNKDIADSKENWWHVNYGIGFDLAMKPAKDLFEFELGVNATLDEAKYYKGTESHTAPTEKAFAFGTKITSKPVSGLELTYAFDGGHASTVGTDKKFAWDTSFNAKYKWIGGGVYVASAGTPFEGKNADGKATADLGVYAKFETKGDKPEDADFLVKGLDAGAYLGVYKLLTNIEKNYGKNYTYPMLMKLYASYKMPIAEGMWIKPYGEFWGETNHTKVGAGVEAVKKPYLGVMYKLGLAFQPVEKVEIDAFWQHGKKADNNLAGGMGAPDYVLTPAQHKNHNGMLKLAVKLSY